MILDGKQLAHLILTRTRARAEALGREPSVAAVVVDPSPATESYLAIKTRRAIEAGCSLEVVRVSPSVTTVELANHIATLDTDAIIVQLPLPDTIDTQAVCDLIPLDKDADVLSSVARTNGTLLPPVVGAVKEILDSLAWDSAGKRAVVVGEGYLVGLPVATWLRTQGAEVEVLTKESEDSTRRLREADLLVLGAGSPHLVKPEMLKEGVVLIDAGTSELGGAIVGDADPACADVCSLFTPVPGGVGPIAVAKLFENAITLAERATNQK
jgi:methylenetetrahydrofolate dehydrogenase (NADP+)/methenyltetrahydrofolate cyclohydrolase